jgi:hypothetical protein
MTVGEMLRRVSSRELSEWQAYYQVEPFGPWRDDLRAGVQTALIANAIRPKGAKEYKPADFVLVFKEPKPNGERMLEIARTLNAMLGGTENLKKKKAQGS